jgi:hypothetical protein
VRTLIATVAAILLALTLAGCEFLFGATTGGQGPPNMAWAPTPIAPDPGLVPIAKKACLVDTKLQAGIAPNLPLIIQDQRGPGAALFVWSNGKDAASCLAARRPDGSVFMSSASASGVSGVGNRLAVTDSSGGPPNLIEGDTGPGKVVMIELADGTQFQASTGGGRFAAWWPKAAQAVRVRSFDDAGRIVETYEIDALTPFH